MDVKEVSKYLRKFIVDSVAEETIQSEIQKIINAISGKKLEPKQLLEELESSIRLARQDNLDISIDTISLLNELKRDVYDIKRSLDQVLDIPPEILISNFVSYQLLSDKQRKHICDQNSLFLDKLEKKSVDFKQEESKKKYDFENNKDELEKLMLEGLDGFTFKDILDNESGFGIILKAEKDEKEYALKIPKNYDKSDRLFVEAKILRRLEGVKGIPKVIESNIENDKNKKRSSESSDKEIPYFAMDYYDYPSLDKVVEGWSFEKKKEACKSLLRVVEKIHVKKILHNDIKPQNILLNGLDALLIDFGSAKSFGADISKDVSRRTNSSETGTLSYMDPRILNGEKGDYQSDIYSIGVTLYNLFTGKKPEIGKKLSDINTGNKQLDAIIKRCVHEDLEKRYQYVSDICVDFEKIKKKEKKQGFFKKFMKRTLITTSSLLAISALIGLSYMYNDSTVPKNGTRSQNFDNGPSIENYEKLQKALEKQKIIEETLIERVKREQEEKEKYKQESETWKTEHNRLETAIKAANEEAAKYKKEFEKIPGLNETISSLTKELSETHDKYKNTKDEYNNAVERRDAYFNKVSELEEKLRLMVDKEEYRSVKEKLEDLRKKYEDLKNEKDISYSFDIEYVENILDNFSVGKIGLGLIPIYPNISEDGRYITYSAIKGLKKNKDDNNSNKENLFDWDIFLYDCETKKFINLSNDPEKDDLHSYFYFSDKEKKIFFIKIDQFTEFSSNIKVLDGTKDNTKIQEVGTTVKNSNGELFFYDLNNKDIKKFNYSFDSSESEQIFSVRFSKDKSKICFSKAIYKNEDFFELNIMVIDKKTGIEGKFRWEYFIPPISEIGINNQGDFYVRTRIPTAEPKIIAINPIKKKHFQTDIPSPKFNEGVLNLHLMEYPHLIYSVQNKDEKSFYLADLVNKNYTKISNEFIDGEPIALSPNGRYTIFKEEKEKGLSDVFLYLMDNKTKSFRLLKEFGPDSFGKTKKQMVSAKFSADGKRIVFCGKEPDSKKSYQIYLAQIKEK